MPRADDPIRAEVERILHAVVGTAIAVPIAVFTAVPRCVWRRTGGIRRRLSEPAAFVRSVFDVVGSPGPSAAAGQAPVPPAAATDDRSPRPARSSADSLPIEEYQSLAASQVVARLPALTASELGAVRRFEAAHRGRRTVLGRIDQLLSPS